MVERPSLSSLRVLLSDLNRRHFGGGLREPGVQLSTRLRSSAGLADYRAWAIRLSVPYHDRHGWGREAEDTLLHEMIHLWLKQHRRPSGHTREFKALAKGLGCPRYAKRMPPRRTWRYRCAACGLTAEYRRRVSLACRVCCDRHNGGRFTRRFLLALAQD